MVSRQIALLLAATALSAQSRFDAPVVWVTPAPAVTRTAFAYSAGHLFRTRDNGQTWDALSVAERGSPQPELVNLLVTPSTPNVLYAFGRVSDGGVWKSLDYGDTWRVIDVGFRPTSDPVADAIIDAANPATMYARVGTEAYRTGNAGASWSSLAVLLPGGPYFALIASPASRRVFYYANSGTIYRTDNEGSVFGAIYSPPASRPLLAVAVDRLNPDMLLAQYADAEGNELVRSYDSGLHWSPMNSPGTVRKLIAASGNTYYAVTIDGALARTLNAGTIWNLGTRGFLTNVAVDPLDERTVYAAGAGVHRSTDGGATFAPMTGTVRPNFTRPSPFPFRIRTGSVASIEIPVRALENSLWSLPFDASVSESWARLSTTGGIAPATLTLTLDATRLAAGTYTTQVRLTSAQAAAPLAFPVAITVESPGPSAPPFRSSTLDEPIAPPIAPDGSTYLVRPEPPAVLRVVNGITTTYLTESDARTVGATAFRPAHVRFDGAGNLLIAASGSLLRVSPSSNPPIALLASAPAGGSFADVAAEPSGDLLIVDTGRSLILRRSALTGALSVIAGRSGVAGFAGDGGPSNESLLNAPRALVRDTDGSVYVADGSRVRVITPDGLIFSIAELGSRVGDLILDSNGELYATLEAQARSVKLTPLRTLPVIFASGVVNAASNQPFLSPGSLFVIFGANLSDASVTFNGTSAKVTFTGRDQINGQVPYEVALGAATVSVTAAGLTALPVTVAILPAAPGIFTTAPSHASAVNASGAINSETDPAAPGEFVAAYVTGIGRVDPPVASGAVTPAAPQSSALAPSRITLAGRVCEVRSVSLVPNFTGLAQVVFRIPPDLPRGEHTLLVTIAGVESNPALISVGI